MVVSTFTPIQYLSTYAFWVTDENMELKLRLLDAIACIDFHAIGSTDVGHRAAETLRKLGAGANTARQDEAVTNSDWSQRDRLINQTLGKPLGRICSIEI